MPFIEEKANISPHPLPITLGVFEISFGIIEITLGVSKGAVSSQNGITANVERRGGKRRRRFGCRRYSSYLCTVIRRKQVERQKQIINNLNSNRT